MSESVSEVAADASPAEEVVEPVEVDAKTEEVTADVESEAESASAVDDNDEEKTDTSRYERRVKTLHTRYREEQREKQDLQTRLDKAEAELRSRPLPVEVKTLADFGHDEGQYQTYIMERSESVAEAKASKVANEYQDKREAQLRKEQFEAREKTFSVDIDDYREAVYDPDIVISRLMADEVHDSEIGPQMLYYLSKHQAEAMEIAEKSDRGATRAMIKLEQKLLDEAPSTTAKAKPPPPTRLKAGEPGLRVSTTSAASDKMSDEAWVKAENIRLAKKHA